MRVLAVDDERAALDVLCMCLEEAHLDIEPECFASVSSCLEHCRSQGCPDIAFLDVCIGSQTGFDLAMELKQLNPMLNVIFTTAYSEYAPNAFEMHASGYLLKPITSDAVIAELQNLRFPVHRQPKGLYAQTFGNFELFFDGAPIEFSYEKTKELFAYLLDRNGAMCSNASVMVALWETEGHSSYFKRLRKDLVDTLSAVGCMDVLVRKRGYIGLNLDYVRSDVQDLRDKAPHALNAYRGEYMSQYSWAETTNGIL